MGLRIPAFVCAPANQIYLKIQSIHMSTKDAAVSSYLKKKYIEKKKKMTFLHIAEVPLKSEIPKLAPEEKNKSI